MSCCGKSKISLFSRQQHHHRASSLILGFSPSPTSQILSANSLRNPGGRWLSPPGGRGRRLIARGRCRREAPGQCQLDTNGRRHRAVLRRRTNARGRRMREAPWRCRRAGWWQWISSCSSSSVWGAQLPLNHQILIKLLCLNRRVN